MKTSTPSSLTLVDLNYLEPAWATLLAKIRSIHATGKSINVEVFDKYSSRRHKKKLGTLLRREIDNLGGGIHYIVATENHNLRTGADSDDFSFFSRRYRIRIDHNIATPRKKQTLIWDPGNERLTILHADETLLSLIMPWLSRTGMTFVKDLRIYHSTLRLDDINALTENVTKVILEDVDIVMLPFSKPRCRWRSVLFGLIRTSEKGLLPSCQLSQLRRSWVSQNRHNRTAPDKEDDTVMEVFTADTSSGVQAGLEAIVREDVLDNQQNQPREKDQDATSHTASSNQQRVLQVYVAGKVAQCCL